MQTSETGSSQSGFTLVELLVVVFIIGLASAAVVLSVRDPRDTLVAQAERLAARMQAARSYAVINNCGTSILLTSSGYTFARRQHGNWVPLPANVIPGQEWKGGSRPAGGVTLRVVFDPIGLATPTRLHLVRRDENVWIDVPYDGKIRVAS
jgi:general secretion pathway protein H